jgi:hypothetical protein
LRTYTQDEQREQYHSHGNQTILLHDDMTCWQRKRKKKVRKEGEKTKKGEKRGRKKTKKKKGEKRNETVVSVADDEWVVWVWRDDDDDDVDVVEDDTPDGKGFRSWTFEGGV